MAALYVTTLIDHLLHTVVNNFMVDLAAISCGGVCCSECFFHPSLLIWQGLRGLFTFVQAEKEAGILNNNSLGVQEGAMTNPEVYLCQTKMTDVVDVLYVNIVT